MGGPKLARGDQFWLPKLVPGDRFWRRTDFFVTGQKRNKVNRVSLTIQYLNQVFDNKEQLINIDIVYLFSFSR